MPETIAEREAIPENQRRLRAQAALYARAKQVYSWRAFVSLGVPLIWSVVSAIDPTTIPAAAATGLAITLADHFLLQKLESNLRATAAAMQELFDCDVLELPAGRLLGLNVSTEHVVEASISEKGAAATVSRWYPSSASTVPTYVGRLICQRANLRWEGKQRELYGRVLALIPFALVVVGIGVNLSLDSSLRACVLQLATVQPVIMWVIELVLRNREAAQRAHRLRESAEGLWREALGAGPSLGAMLAGSRLLQDGIFEHRESAPLVFDKVHHWLRERFSKEMEQTSDELAKEYLASR